jgi:hypothetical protein
MYQILIILDKLYNGLVILWYVRIFKVFCSFSQLLMYWLLLQYQEINGIKKILKDIHNLEKLSYHMLYDNDCKNL